MRFFYFLFPFFIYLFQGVCNFVQIIPQIKMHIKVRCSVTKKKCFYFLSIFYGQIWTEVKIAGAELFVQFVDMDSMYALPLSYNFFVPVPFLCFLFIITLHLNGGEEPLQSCASSLCQTFRSCVRSTHYYLLLCIHVYNASLHLLCMFAAIFVQT